MEVIKYFRDKTLRISQSSEDIKRSYLNKARHNLEAANLNSKEGFDDWGIIASYYAAYHAALSVLAKMGVVSKSHIATISFLYAFLAKEKILDEELVNNLDKLREVQEELLIKDKEIINLKDLKKKRISAQYGLKTSFNKDLVSDCLKTARDLVVRFEEISDNLTPDFIDKTRILLSNLLKNTSSRIQRNSKIR